MELFKKEKGQPFKLRGFDYVGCNANYGNVCYYTKTLPRDNFEIMECVVEAKVSKFRFLPPIYEIGAGTTVKVIDAFMAHYLYNIRNGIKKNSQNAFIKGVLETTYGDFTKEQKEMMISKFTSAIPEEIKEYDDYKKYIKSGYKLLYCSNDETKERLFGIVNLVLVKDEHIKSDDKRINIDSHYTLFKPFKFRVSPLYLNKKSKVKYLEEDIPEIAVNHDLLV